MKEERNIDRKKQIWEKKEGRRETLFLGYFAIAPKVRGFNFSRGR
jgi:hypothetical protein